MAIVTRLESVPETEMETGTGPSRELTDGRVELVREICFVRACDLASGVLRCLRDWVHVLAILAGIDYTSQRVSWNRLCWGTCLAALMARQCRSTGGKGRNLPKVS
jgi:hypothetical protein